MVEDVKVLVIGDCHADLRRTLTDAGVEVIDRMPIVVDQGIGKSKAPSLAILALAACAMTSATVDWPSGVTEDKTPWYRKLEKKRKKR